MIQPSANRNKTRGKNAAVVVGLGWVNPTETETSAWETIPVGFLRLTFSLTHRKYREIPKRTTHQGSAWLLMQFLKSCSTLHDGTSVFCTSMHGSAQNKGKTLMASYFIERYMVVRRMPSANETYVAEVFYDLHVISRKS